MLCEPADPLENLSHRVVAVRICAKEHKHGIKNYGECTWIKLANRNCNCYYDFNKNPFVEWGGEWLTTSTHDYQRDSCELYIIKIVLAIVIQ